MHLLDASATARARRPFVGGSAMVNMLFTVRKGGSPAVLPPQLGGHRAGWQPRECAR